MTGRPDVSIAVACFAVVLVGVAAGTAVASDGPAVAVGNVTTDLEPGMSTRATVEVTNAGDAWANDTRLRVTASGGVTVDGAPGTGSSDVIGDLPPGATRRVALVVQASEATSPGDKPLGVTVTYTNETGAEQTIRDDNLTIPVMQRQRFSLVELEDTLTVGYEGEIRGVVRNDGNRTIRDGVLRIVPATESFVVDDRGYALPTMGPGETAEFTYATDVSGQAAPGPRQVQFSVAYVTEADTPQQSPMMTERVVIDESDGEFDLEMRAPADGTIGAGNSTTVVVAVTNRRPEPLTNVRARAYAERPFSSRNDEAFVDRIAPNETAEIRFGVDAADDAPPNTHPLEVDFQYESAGGQTSLSEPYFLPLEVVETNQDSDASLLAIGAVGLGVVLAALAVALVVRGRGSAVPIRKVVGALAVGLLLLRPL